MEIIGKPFKCLPWQITSIIDNYGNKKINIRIYAKSKAGVNFNKSQNIYCTPDEWGLLKREIFMSMRRK